MLARFTGSAMRAPRVGGQPRGGGTSGPAAGWEWIDPGSESAPLVGTSATTVTSVAGTVSVVATHVVIVAQLPSARSTSHESLGACVGAASCEAWDAGIAAPCAEFAVPASDPHRQLAPSSVSCRSRRALRNAVERRSDRIWRESSSGGGDRR